MTSETDVFGVFFSGAFAAACLAFIMLLVLRRVLHWTGFYKFVWHRHLVDLAFFTILWAVSTGLAPIFIDMAGRLH
jgi:hypothetical protein